MKSFKSQFANPFYTSNSLAILLFFSGWGIWWSFFQIWLTTEQGFTGSQVGTIYSFNSTLALLLMFIYGSIQDKLGIKKWLLIFCVGCEVLLGPFFTWVYVPMLKSNFYIGVLLGSLYLSAAFLAVAPTFEALAERMGRCFNFEYGQARAWGSFGYAIAALASGFLFTINPYLIFWAGSALALVLLLVLLLFRPEKNSRKVAEFVNLTGNQEQGKSPSMREIFSVFKIFDVWKIIFFIILSWSFYTIFDQQMFPEFFTRFFSTPEVGQQAYGVLNSVGVFLESVMLGIVPILMRKWGVRKILLAGLCIMILRIGGCGLVTNPFGISIIKLLHAPETSIFILAIFRYFTLHFDTRISATLYMVGFQVAAQIGQIIFSRPLGELHDKVGYQQTFLVVAGAVLISAIYAFFVLKKDDQDVNGQPLEQD